MSLNEPQESLENILAADLPVAVSTLTDIKNAVTQVNQMVENILTRVKNNELDTKEGMSFLDVKNNLLLSYLVNLGFCALRKVSGESIQGEQCIERLVEIRTIMERMRPVEHKLKYQIEKFIKLAASEKYDESDPLQFKANPNNLVAEEEDESGTDDEAKDKKKAGIYVPPKIMPMNYDGETAQERASKSSEKAKRLALSASAIQNLKEEYMDAPAEINESSANGYKASLARERQERQEYEETYFTRLPTTKEDRHRFRQKYSSSAFANELVGMGSSKSETSGKRKGDKGKKKGFKKRRKF